MATRIRLALVFSHEGSWSLGLFARRLCGALLSEGVEATLLPLESILATGCDAFDVCWVLSPLDFLHEPVGDDRSERRSLVLRSLETLRSRVPVMVAVLAEAPMASGYQNWRDLLASVGFERMLVFGLTHDIRWREGTSDDGGIPVQEVPDGLTVLEEALVPADTSAENAVLPWCLLGSSEHRHWKVAQALVEQVDSRGFLYLPKSRQPEQRQRCLDLPQGNFRQALARSRWFVWCARCESCHLDSAPWRAALLAGTVPIMAMPVGVTVPLAAPLRGLTSPTADLGATIKELDRRAAFAQLRRTFLAMPRLGTTLRACLLLGGSTEWARPKGP